MTQSFDAKDDSELLVLLKERVRTAHLRDEKLDEKLDMIIKNQHEMDKKADRTADHLAALQDDHKETKARLDTVEADRKSVWLHVASILSQIGLWGAK